MDGNGRGTLDRVPRHEVRRLVSEEALGRIDELEEKLAVCKGMINRHASAMEALANAITQFSTELALLQAWRLERDAIRQRLEFEAAQTWGRVARETVRVWLQGVSRACDRWLRAHRDNVVSFRRLPPEE